MLTSPGVETTYEPKRVLVRLDERIHVICQCWMPHFCTVLYSKFPLAGVNLFP